jgi:magnesium-transporting ATPase (P-type)
MRRPPRDLQTDRLISGALLRHAYLVVGVAEAAACMLSFFAVFWWRGVPLSSVFGSVPTYWSAEPLSPDLTLCPPAAPSLASAAEGGNAFAGTPASSASGGAGAGNCRVLSGEQQRAVYFEAQAAWYACLVCCQFFHVWTCKTRRAPLFKHGPMRNAVTAWGCAVALTVMLVVVFVPFLQPIFQTAPVPGVAWLPAVGFGVWVFLYTEASKRRARERPDGWWARKMAW